MEPFTPALGRLSHHQGTSVESTSHLTAPNYFLPLLPFFPQSRSPLSYLTSPSRYGHQENKSILLGCRP